MSRQAQRTLLLLCLHPNYNQVRRHALAHLTHLLSPPKSDSTSHPDDVSRVHSISISLLTSLTSCLAATLSSRRLTLSTTLPVDATVTTRIWQVYTSPITNVNSVLDHFCSESWQPGISAHLAVLIKLIVYVPSGLNRRFPSDGPSHIGHTRGRTVSDAGPVTGDALVCKKLSQKNRCHQPDLPTLEEKARRLELLVMATYASSFPILVHDAPQFWHQLRQTLGFPISIDLNSSSYIDFARKAQVCFSSMIGRLFLNTSGMDHADRISLARLATFAPISFGLPFISIITQRLSCQEFISASQREIGIMLTPAGQLYNQELIESLPKYEKSWTNLRRENRVYSYEVQMDILAAQREREASLRQKSAISAAGGLRPILEQIGDRLTQTQRETVQNELDKESAIRHHMIWLDLEACRLLDLLAGFLHACAGSIEMHLIAHNVPNLHGATLSSQHPESSGLPVATVSRLHDIWLSATTPKQSCRLLATENQQYTKMEHLNWRTKLLSLIYQPYLADLLPRLLASPLTSPYALRTHIGLILLCFASKDEAHFPNAMHQLVAWWSLRLSAPVRLILSREDDLPPVTSPHATLISTPTAIQTVGSSVAPVSVTAILSEAIGRPSIKDSSEEDREIAIQLAIKAAHDIVETWSATPLSLQTVAVLEYLAKLPMANESTLMVFSALFHSFERLFVRSGWSQSYTDAVINLSLPHSSEQVQNKLNTEQESATRYFWFGANQMRTSLDLMRCILQPLDNFVADNSSYGDDLGPDAKQGLSNGRLVVVLTMIPFGKIYTSLCHLIDGCIVAQSESADFGEDEVRRHLQDVEEADVFPGETLQSHVVCSTSGNSDDTSSELDRFTAEWRSEAGNLAQIAVSVFHLASGLHSNALSRFASPNLNLNFSADSARLLLSNELGKARIWDRTKSVLCILLDGMVSEAALTREVALLSLLTYSESVPDLVNVISASSEPKPASNSEETGHAKETDPVKPYSSPTLCGKENELSSAPAVNAANADLADHGDLAEGEEAPKVGEVAESEGQKKRRPTKGQKKRAKLANLSQADAVVAEGYDLGRDPYQSPALWPSLPIWSIFQVRLWIARSDLCSDVSSTAERLWKSLHLDSACESPHPRQSSLLILREEPDPLLLAGTQPYSLHHKADLLPPAKLAERVCLEATRPVRDVQRAASESLAFCLAGRQPTPTHLAILLDWIIALYRRMLKRDPAIKDNLDRILKPASPDCWRQRVGLAGCLGALAEWAILMGRNASAIPNSEAVSSAVDDELADRPVTAEFGTSSGGEGGHAAVGGSWLLMLFNFFVPEGLNDRHSAVQSAMLQAALIVGKVYGHHHISQLLPILETFLNKAPNSAEFDAVRQSVIILTGSIGCHLEAGEPRIISIFNRLLNTLKFPSEVVQQAVEDCLSPLVCKLTEEQITAAIQRLLNILLSSAGYAERHGAAHGLAGLVRGAGILSLRQYGIIDRLMSALEDKQRATYRESALFAYERLCLGLGRLFEPYIVRLMSGLLSAFGDVNTNVREAAANTARAVMSRLSAHGVKLALPSLLKVIDEDGSWRTKVETVSLLATMTQCAPKQLSACLPQIVPRLLTVLLESQPQLRQAGGKALTQIGGVIRNPEVQALVPRLITCLQDPLANKTSCLLALRDTCFVHVIDAPSLALIMPVVQRAFDDRSTETRKMAAQIFGNLYSLAKKEDLQPYVGSVMPGLKTCLLDPVPEVRSVAARALGAMVRGMGESCFKELLPWLMSTLTSESSSVDRSGAAQGLAEVLGGMGVDRLKAILPDLIKTVSSGSRLQPRVRDGYLMLFIYLPTVFEEAFADYIGSIVPAILQALSDETEFLRETALRAGQRIVQLFADKAIELLLPELERGMVDSNWRIRHASVHLLGDLLYKISGQTGKGTTKTIDEDDTFGTEAVHQRILEKLSVERRDRVLAQLHIARSDPTQIVRQAAVHVWKVVVSNTPRTLREILPVLIRLLLSMLGSFHREQQQVAARALGDIVRKLGDRILADIIPILEAGLDSEITDQRRGVCTGLIELMRNCTKEQLSSANYSSDFIVFIRRAISDHQPEVRRAGARAFDLLHNSLGVRAIDGLLPDLLAQLDASQQDSAQHAATLDGLRQLLTVKSKAVMPHLVPKLTTPKVNAKAFAFLAAVAGDSLTRHLGRLMPALLMTVSELSTDSSDLEAQEELSHCAAVLICISEVSGVRTILSDLINGMSSTGPLGPTQAGTTGKVSKSQQHQQQSSLTPHPPQIPQPSTHLVFGTIGYKLASVRLLSAYLMLANEHRLAHVAAISGTGINANGEGSGILATDVNIAGAEVGGKDKAQKSPKAKKKSTVVMTTAGTRSTDSTTDSEDEDDATSSVYSDSETDESDEEDDEDDEESDILTESDEDDLDLEDEAEEAFEVIARVLPEFYPLLTRNLCRLLAVNDKFILHNVWQCLECLFSQWQPDNIVHQLNDLRQAIRGAVAELKRLQPSLGDIQACSPLALPNEPNQQSIQQLNLPGFSDPDLPISSLIKLYADCILHGRVSLKETAAQGLAECVALADGCAMQRCVVKVIGPMIRLLGERHSNVVRFAVIEALVLLMSKCTMATRPFVTQLQATFAKSLGDPNRPSRLLAGRGLVNLASMTPKLDVLLVDLAKAAASSSLVTACLPTRSAGAAKVISSASGLRTPSQAVTGVSLYPDTGLQALRYCLYGSGDRASLSALCSVTEYLTPLLDLPDDSSLPSAAADMVELDDETTTPTISMTATRTCAAACLGAAFAAAWRSCHAATVSTAHPNSDFAMEPANLLAKALLPPDKGGLNPVAANPSRYFLISQAVALMVALKMAPEGLISEVVGRVNPEISQWVFRLIGEFCAIDKLNIAQSGLRCLGYLIGYLVETNSSSPLLLSAVQLLAKGMRHDSTDIRLLTSFVAGHISWRTRLSARGCKSDVAAVAAVSDSVKSDLSTASTAVLVTTGGDWLKCLIGLLVNGTRERAGPVRLASETAIVLLCRLGAPGAGEGAAVQSLLNQLDQVSRNSLAELIPRLKKQNWDHVWRQGCPDLDDSYLQAS